MSYDAHKNFAYSTVLSAPSPAASGTSLTVQSGDGALFPAVPFNATVWASGVLALNANAEIVRVIAIAGDVFTITRAQEGTTAKSILVGFQIAATITAKITRDTENNWTGNLIFVDKVNGNDSTAIRGSTAYPFRTITAAKAASVS